MIRNKKYYIQRKVEKIEKKRKMKIPLDTSGYNHNGQ